MQAVLRSVQHSDEKLRELAMAAIKDLLRSQPQRFKAFTEHVLLRLLRMLLPLLMATAVLNCLSSICHSDLNPGLLLA